MTTTQTTTKIVIDCAGKSVGRVATEIAKILIGKDTTSFTKNVIREVEVEAINASKVNVKGKKMKSQLHKRFSLFPGGLSTPNWSEVVSKKGYAEVIKHAVDGMLPKNKLQNKRLLNLTISE
jgi:large subunit ribosomal protein L13